MIDQRGKVVGLLCDSQPIQTATIERQSTKPYRNKEICLYESQAEELRK
jgi:hypothetical protein